MELEEALREYINQNTGDGLVVGTVLHVTDAYTFDVEDADGNTYLDVRMNAKPGPAGLIVTPRVGSTVFIMDLGNLGQEYVLIHASEVDEVQVIVEPATEIFIDDENIRLGGGKVEPAVLGNSLNGNLGDLIERLANLITALDTFCTTQGAAATGTLAPLAPAYTALKSSLTSIQSALNTVENSLDNHISDTVTLAP